ncbi:MAG: cytochrome b5 domain-containing protein [Filifactoraceae bacterium]
MKRHNLALVAGILVLSLGLVGCSAKEEANTTPKTKTAAPETSVAEMKEFTVEELAKYNGKDGEKAYIAIEGIVYDVTEDPAWKDGEHNGFSAGKDLTEEIKKDSPHGVAKLEGLTQVGTLKK